MKERLWQWFRRFDSAWVTPAVTAAGYLAFLFLRLKANHFEPSAFIMAGDRYTNPEAVGVPVLRFADGYDGQFYYRLALDPFTSEQTEHGVTLDRPAYRQQRILYPLLVWALSLRFAEAVPWMMIAVNFGAICLLAWLAAKAAQGAGNHALWGLALAFYPGFLLSLARDLVEIPAMTLLLSSLMLLRKGKPLLGGVCLALAGLTRETTLVVAGAATAVRLLAPNGKLNWTFALLPLVAGGFWQLWLFRVWGEWPILSGGHNLGLPFDGVNEQIRSVADLNDPRQQLIFVELLFVAVCFVSMGVAAVRSADEPVERSAWWLYFVLAVCLTQRVWVEDWAFLRVLSELFVIGWLLLLGRAWWLRLPVLAGSLGLWLLLFRARLY